MITTQKFNLDLSASVGPLVLYAMQADSMSRFFAITVTDNGTAWTPPDGAAWTVRFGAPGMPAGWYDTITEPGGGTHPAIVVDENTATVEIAEQAVSTPGNNVLCVLVTDAQGYQIASWPFALNVQGVPGFDAPEATVYYNALTAQVAQVLANAQAAATSATLAESWAVGGTGTREGENTNNAQYYAQQAQSIAGGQLGWFETEQALEAAHPTGQNGQWAIIGSTDTIWTWDSDTSAWVNSGSTADLSNYYTKTQADAAFATAAQGALATSAVQSVNGKSGTAVTLNPQDVGGISTYTCTTSGTTHALAGTGNNIKFVADAEYKSGDTITVNGQPVTAQTQDGAALADGAWASGATVVCWLNGTTLTFNGTSAANTEHIVDEHERQTGELFKWVDGLYYHVWEKSVEIDASVFSSVGSKTVEHGAQNLLTAVDYRFVFLRQTGASTVFGQNKVDGGASAYISLQCDVTSSVFNIYVARAMTDAYKTVAVIRYIKSGEGQTQ